MGTTRCRQVISGWTGGRRFGYENDSPRSVRAVDFHFHATRALLGTKGHAALLDCLVYERLYILKKERDAFFFLIIQQQQQGE